MLGQEKSESNIRLLEEAKRFFSKAYFAPISGVSIGIGDDFAITHKSVDLTKFDAIFPRVPRKLYNYSYQLMSMFPPERFMAISPVALLVAAERFFMLTVLKKRGVPVLNSKLARSPEAATRLLDELEFPTIIRVPGQKTGVVANKAGEAKTIIDALGSLDHPLLLEETVKDMISAFVAQPEVLASVRKSTKEKDIVFGSGEMKKHKMGLETRELALEAARAMNASVMRVDISLNGSPKVVNIELNPELMAASGVSDVNIPRMMMKSIHENYSKHTERPVLVKLFDDAKSVMRDVFKEKQLL
jgi:glutathione synthase/RimK-type ligase-like ATP-grasp enzyme